MDKYSMQWKASRKVWRTAEGRRPLPRHLPTPQWNGMYDKHEEWPDTMYNPNNAKVWGKGIDTHG